MALKENPDLVLSRLEQQKAESAIRIAKDPFVPKIYGGSGLAKVWGYPTSIEGSAPSIIQTRTDMALFNRPKTYELARVRETARGAEIDTESKNDQVAYQTATLFLDAQQLERNKQSLQLEVESLERVSSATGVQVEEGRQLAIENKRVAVDVARAGQRLSALSGDLDYAEASLAVVLGYPAADRIQPRPEERAAFEIPASEQAATELALENSKDIRKLESQLQAKGFEVKEAEATRLPVVDLVAQYALVRQDRLSELLHALPAQQWRTGRVYPNPAADRLGLQGAGFAGADGHPGAAHANGSGSQSHSTRYAEELSGTARRRRRRRKWRAWTWITRAIRFRCFWRSWAKVAQRSSKWTMRGLPNRRSGSRSMTRSTRLRTPVWTCCAKRGHCWRRCGELRVFGDSRH